jgi:hypothetical protein
MGSGFIYLIIMGMWAAYFLPQWLSNHEDSSGKAIQRYKNAMQIVAESNGSIKSESNATDKNNIYLKRRLIFGSLFSLYALSLTSAVIGFLDLVTTLVPHTGILIYFVNVRKQVIASQLKMRRLKALERITNSKIPTTVIPERVKEKSSNEHWVPFADREEITGVVVVPKDRKGWQPTTIPKPVYTTAAKAIPSKRIIDLTSTGQWSAEQELIKALSGRDDDFFDQETLVQVSEEVKAVNE